MNKIFSNKESGFSLVELMIVIGIIGILATMAMPKFQEFQSKAKMAEAKTTLSHLYTMQHSFFLENDRYQRFAYITSNGGNCRNQASDALGFQIQPCNAQVPRYQYRTAVSTDGQEFDGFARSKASVCQNKSIHYFGIDENKSFKGPKSCSQAERSFSSEGSVRN